MPVEAPAGLRGDLWPTRFEGLLLRAALLDRERALEAWAELRSTLDLDTLHGEPIRLLPLLYRNLSAHGVTDELLMPRLRGVYQHTWYTNQMRLSALLEITEQLADADVPVLALKGAALLPAYYGDVGVRPMTDVDLLVHPGDVERAVGLLVRSGWAPQEPGTARGFDTDRPRDLAAAMSRLHALTLVRDPTTERPTRANAPPPPELDLHWELGALFVLPDVPAAWAADLWRTSVHTELRGTQLRVLGPADQLLQAVAHGFELRSLARLRWPADAYTVLRVSGEAMDWERVVEQAERWRLAPQLHDALRYLEEALDASVPPEVLRRLAALPVTRRERLAYRLMRNWRTYDTAARWRFVAMEYLRWGARWHPLRAALALPRFLRWRFEIAHAWQAPAEAWRRWRARRRRAETGVGDAGAIARAAAAAATRSEPRT